MLADFKNQLKTNFSFLTSKKLLIAISGGIDSVVLTHLLYRLNFDITLAHCNFNLRENESNKDEEFVKTTAKNLKINVFTTSFNTKEFAAKNKLSIQEAARNLRYKWFNELLDHNNLDYVLTAHNLNDNLETFLINLTRGTGLQGLTGIPIINNKTVRPLLEFSRAQIIKFALDNNISWREDVSNTDTKYTRNKIRHKIVPILQEINPNVLDSFKKTLTHLNGSQDIINETIDTKFNNKNARYNIQEILETANPKAYLYELFKIYEFTAWKDIYNLLTAENGKQIFSKTHRLIKDNNFLLLQEKRKKKEERNKTDDTFLIQENDVEFGIQHLKFKISNSKSYHLDNHFLFDKDLLKFPLTVRRYQKDDYFYPLGMTGKKKISKFLKDEKYSLLEKENIWLLLSDNKIVWVIGKRQDNRFKITDKTQNTIAITITP